MIRKQKKFKILDEKSLNKGILKNPFVIEAICLFRDSYDFCSLGKKEVKISEVFSNMNYLSKSTRYPISSISKKDFNVLLKLLIKNGDYFTKKRYYLHRVYPYMYKEK